MVSYFIKFNRKDTKKLYKNQKRIQNIYKKCIKVLLENILGNIEKEGLKVNGLVKSDKRGLKALRNSTSTLLATFTTA